jgi:nitroimidazol reductase NimA-like FMN-containing flavoprotein (pyridoxamine 5'-phosphate oxidase superfamily)
MTTPGQGDENRTLAVLDTGQCRDLLPSVNVGRIVYLDETVPSAAPVNYVVAGDQVVFRTVRGSRLADAVTGALVGFEVDQVDHQNLTGWSVLISGHCQEVPAGPQAGGLNARLHSWAPGDRGLLLGVAIENISGRRIG